MTRYSLAALIMVVVFTGSLPAQTAVAPYDLWTPEILAKIRDRSTLEISSTQRLGYTDVFFTSNPAANFFDSSAPYAERQNERIRIHGFLATPLTGGPFPAVVIGHGHGGQADFTTALLVASFGYVAFYIDGPQAGQSTGGPKDDNQAWISVDKGPQYSYLYHYAYAGMRALTALEELAALPGNPYRIDSSKLGVFGASMGGIFTTHINAVDERVKAAVILASAGNWPHTLRYPNSWLYHGIYTGTRDRPYNGNDPLNSIEDIDTDPTAVTFLNYFDPIRYAARQHAPVLTLIGTHDEYFPLPNANLMLQAIASAGKQSNFEKRLWMLPNAPHALDTAVNILNIAASLRHWFDYAFGKRAKPLATPKVTMIQGTGGLRFEIALAETTARLTGALAALHVATRVDSTVSPIRDFKSYDASREGDKFVVQLPNGERSGSGEAITSANAIYYATVTDSGGLPVSALVSKGGVPMDLSTDFTPAIEHYPGDNISVPLPPAPPDAATSIHSSIPVPADRAYQGMALSNATDKAMVVRVEARTPEGRIAAAEGLINPAYLHLPSLRQRVFLAEEWLGPGARSFDGSLRAVSTDLRATSLSFRGNATPSELEAIGPLVSPSNDLWLPLVPTQDLGATRRIRVFGTTKPADVQILFRSKSGTAVATKQVTVASGGNVDVPLPSSTGSSDAECAELQASNPVSARLETSGARDPWSIEARPAPTANRYAQPHTEWNGLFKTTIIATNPSGQRRSFSLNLRKTDGSLVAASTRITIEPFAVTADSVENLMGIGSGFIQGAGWLELDAPDGPLVVTALATDGKRGAAAASAVDAAAAGVWSMPFFVQNEGYWTGLAIANAEDRPLQVAVTAYDQSGNKLASANVTLETRQSKTQLTSQWLPTLPSNVSGQIVITATGPVSLLAYFGTADGASMAAIPFQQIRQ